MAKHKPHRYFLYVFARLLAGIFTLLPESAALALARGGARLGYRLAGRQRKEMLESLRVAYPAESAEKLQATGIRVFENLGMTAAEVLRFPKLTLSRIERMIDFGNVLEIYDAVLKEGRGVLSLSAHFGNWELLAAAFGLKGYQGLVLARRIYYEPYNRWIVGLRLSAKVPTLYRNDASREVLKRLRAGEIVGIVPDQDIDSLKGVFVPFFGRPAYTALAPARLALASGAPIIPAFLVRTGPGRYRMIAGQVLRASQAQNRDDAAAALTHDWMAEFEKVIRLYPEQWAWMHRRWKTKPLEDIRNEREVMAS